MSHPYSLYLAPAAAGKTAHALARARQAAQGLQATPRVVVPTQLQARAWRRRLDHYSPKDDTIVEFKTDDVRDEAGLARLLAREDYLAQADRYRAAVERLLGQRPEVKLCLLNYGGQVRVVPVGEAGGR
jgi:ATP-dependent exoDNAse (exonuclease V) beta subunit